MPIYKYIPSPEAPNGYSVRSGKPTNVYLATLKKKPSKALWDALVKACVESLILATTDYPDVRVKFSYVLKFPKDFPRGILEEKGDTYNLHRIKARKLLQWMFDKGHTTISPEVVGKQHRRFEIDLTLLENSVDRNVSMDNNCNSEITEGDTIGTSE